MTRVTEEPRFDFGQRKRVFRSPPRLDRLSTPSSFLLFDCRQEANRGELGSEADDSSASTTTVKNACWYTSIPLFVRVSWCSVQFLRLLCLQPTMIWNTTAPVYVELFSRIFSCQEKVRSSTLSCLYASFYQKRDNRIITNGNTKEIKLNSILCKWRLCVWASTLNSEPHALNKNYAA
jgi:hypothetical protein